MRLRPPPKNHVSGVGRFSVAGVLRQLFPIGFAQSHIIAFMLDNL